jgi:hypothetical protein
VKRHFQVQLIERRISTGSRSKIGQCRQYSLARDSPNSPPDAARLAPRDAGSSLAAPGDVTPESLQEIPFHREPAEVGMQLADTLPLIAGHDLTAKHSGQQLLRLRLLTRHYLCHGVLAPCKRGWT